MAGEKKTIFRPRRRVIDAFTSDSQVISGARNKSTITRTTDFGRSPISDIFGGKLRLRVHREGDHSSDNIEPFFTLKLVIEVSSCANVGDPRS